MGEHREHQESRYTAGMRDMFQVDRLLYALIYAMDFGAKPYIDVGIRAARFLQEEYVFSAKDTALMYSALWIERCDVCQPVYDMLALNDKEMTAFIGPCLPLDTIESRIETLPKGSQNLALALRLAIVEQINWQPTPFRDWSEEKCIEYFEATKRMMNKCPDAGICRKQRPRFDGIYKQGPCFGQRGQC